LTRFLLVRHAATASHDTVLAGRGNIGLSRQGHSAAAILANSVALWKPEVIYSSPQERAVQTAGILARGSAAKVVVRNNLAEVNFGDWTGLEFSQLDSLESWRRFNSFRSGAHVPNGESMLEVQHRIIQELEHYRQWHAYSTVAVVSHADVLRPAIGYWLGIPFDLLQRIEVAPASLTVLEISDYDVRLKLLNSAPHEISATDIVEDAAVSVSTGPGGAN
jgi:broad specificity phosphatase PhoE